MTDKNAQQIAHGLIQGAFSRPIDGMVSAFERRSGSFWVRELLKIHVVRQRNLYARTLGQAVVFARLWHNSRAHQPSPSARETGATEEAAA